MILEGSVVGSGSFGSFAVLAAGPGAPGAIVGTLSKPGEFLAIPVAMGASILGAASHLLYLY